MDALRPVPSSTIRTAYVLALALAGSLASGAALVAQPTPAAILPSTVIPNYDRIRIGQVEGLEGGAYVARTGDAGANWYNPAGLALAAGTSLNASANAYEFTRITLEGLDAGYGAGRFNSLGTYFAGVIGEPVVHGDRLRLGFSFTRPVSWSPGAVSGATERTESGDIESLGFYSQVSLSTFIPALAAGYRLTERVRIGLGVGLPITKLTTTQELSNRLIGSSAVERIDQTLSLDGQAYQLQFTAGLQWDLTDAIKLGAAFTSPGAGLGGSALLGLRSSIEEPDATAELTFRDAEAEFDYQLPMKVVGGVAVQLGRFEVEADVRHYGSRAAYSLLATDSSYTLVSTDASGTPTVTEGDPVPISETGRAVTNVAVGANFPLSDRWRIHGGVFTDQSPIGDPETSLFRAVDLTGIGFAVSFGGSLSGTIGVSSSWGTTAERDVGPSLGGLTAETSVTIRTVNLHYALSYTFN